MSNTIEQLDSQIRAKEKEAIALQSELNVLKKDLQNTTLEISRLEELKVKTAQAIEVLMILQETNRQLIQEHFEKIVTYALQYIYSADYIFKFEFERKGNFQGLNFNIISPSSQEPLDLLESSGGGVLDIVSLALRVAFLDLAYPKVEGPLILDESMKHLSKDYLSRAAEFLNVISDKLGRQIIFVTHQHEFLEKGYNNIEIS